MSDDAEKLHWFRRLLLLVLGSGLLGGGLAYTFFALLASRLFYPWFTLGAGFMVAIGAYILWEDIVRPAVRHLRRRVRAGESRASETHRGGGRTR